MATLLEIAALSAAQINTAVDVTEDIARTDTRPKLDTQVAITFRSAEDGSLGGITVHVARMGFDMTYFMSDLIAAGILTTPQGQTVMAFLKRVYIAARRGATP